MHWIYPIWLISISFMTVACSGMCLQYQEGIMGSFGKHLWNEGMRYLLAQKLYGKSHVWERWCLISETDFQIPFSILFHSLISFFSFLQNFKKHIRQSFSAAAVAVLTETGRFLTVFNLISVTQAVNLNVAFQSKLLGIILYSPQNANSLE